ncbi:hypothetical protein HNR53_003385 [Bacillus benzoevorans]|uniref:Uncharacterized protein n=1 Tax=Bacillus benzoevorans TaxID=1456 RepID=A0A7X0HW73_9BACI|nr:hypothetical protein [Bacillus benzoevorans]
MKVKDKKIWTILAGGILCIVKIIRKIDKEDRVPGTIQRIG